MKKRNLSNAINNLRKHNTSSSSLRPSKLINSTFNQEILNNILQYSNKDILNRNNFINNHKGYHSYNNKVIKINRNRNNNKTYNDNISSSINLFNLNNNNNRTMNYNDYISQKENSVNYNSNNVSDNESAFNYNDKDNYLRNYNSYNSHGSITRKYYELNDDQKKLIQKIKTKPISLNGNDYYNKNKIRPSHMNEETHKDPQNNITNKIKSHFMINNPNNKIIKSALNHNMPIRLNYYDNSSKKNGNNDLKKENIKKAQNKINDMKKKVGFEGNNDEFIEYIKILKIKADITELVINMFNNDKNIDEDGIKKCFLNLEHLMSNKVKEDKNLLNTYQYLVEQLLQVNNINKNDILNNN